MLRSTRIVTAVGRRHAHTLRPAYGMWIDGKEVDAAEGHTLAIENPATGEIVSTVQEGREADMNLAIESASRAFEDGRW
jgi:acyl-CoA reductase-like NAD-dependent aldehyde dehydrogenase